jgi:hypothetical protein
MSIDIGRHVHFCCRTRSQIAAFQGRVPAARGRAVALRVEPLSKAQRLAPSGGHPSRGLAATLRARWRAGCRRTAARGAWPVRSPMQRSRLRLHRKVKQPGQAGGAGGHTTAARSRARGSRALFPSRVRERGPLDELTGLQVAALRSARCGAGQIVNPVTRHARCRAAECLESDRSGSTAAPVAALCVTSAAEAPDLRGWVASSLQPPRQASWHIGRDAAPPEHGAARAPVVPPRSPQLRPRQV